MNDIWNDVTDSFVFWFFRVPIAPVGDIVPVVVGDEFVL